MGDIGVHFLGAVFQQQFRRLAQGAGGVAHIVDHHADLVLYLTDDGHLGDFAGFLTALVDDGEGGVDPFGQFARAGHATDVRRDDHDLVHAVLELLADIQREDRAGVEVVDRNVEEPLNLRGVQIHCQDTFDSRLDQHVGDQFGGDRGPGLGAAILAGIAEIGDHGGHALGRGAAQRIGHDQQFHQVVIRRIGGRLNDEHVLPAHVLEHFDKDLAVIEPLDARINRINVDATVGRHTPSNGFRKRPVGITGDELGFDNIWHGSSGRAI